MCHLGLFRRNCIDWWFHSSLISKNKLEPELSVGMVYHQLTLHMMKHPNEFHFNTCSTLPQKVRFPWVDWNSVVSDPFFFWYAVNSQHHLAAIQYPLNLLEPDAFIKGIQGSKTLQEVANEHNLMHFPIRTLNAALPTVKLFQEHTKKAGLPPRPFDPMLYRLVDVPSRTDIEDLPKKVRLNLPIQCFLIFLTTTSLGTYDWSS